MAKVKCEQCGRIFSAKTRSEAEKMLQEHGDHEIIGEATFYRTRYGSNA